MIFKKLNINQLEYIYNERMKADFHPCEIKPFDLLKSLTEKGFYFPMAAFENNDDDISAALAYFFTAKSKNTGVYVLDYLAVEKNHRGSGIGSAVISHIKQNYGCVIGEVENIEFSADESDRKTRAQRMAFYMSNGFRQSGLRCRQFDENYVIIYLSDKKQSDDVLYDNLNTVYHIYFDDDYLKKNYDLRYKDGKILKFKAKEMLST